MSKLSQIIAENELSSLLTKNYMGLELEEHRLLKDGRISRYPYPAEFLSRRHNPYLKTDFADNMLEISGTPTLGTDANLANLEMLQQLVTAHLQADEIIWPLSIAPAFSKDDLDFAGSFNTRFWMAEYHDYLQQKYGTAREIFTGVHINYSINQTLVQSLWDHGFNEDFATLADFKNALNFKLAQSFVLWRWLFTYFFGASPIAGNLPSNLPRDLRFPVRSLRSSSYGYANQKGEEITYDSFEEQLAQLKERIDQHQFFSMHEFYGPVRLKGRGDSLADLQNNGTERLEFRSFDLNPFAPARVSPASLNFLELFLINALLQPLPEKPAEQLKLAAQRNEQIALQHPAEVFAWVKPLAAPLIKQLRATTAQLDLPDKYAKSLDLAEQRLENPKLTLSGQLLDHISPQGDLLEFGLTTALADRKRIAEYTETLAALKGKCSASLQSLIRQAVELGIKVRLDQRHLHLQLKEHEEIFPIHVTFDYQIGPREYLLSLFPEVLKINNDQQ